MEPKNGMFLTKQDFPQWQDSMSPLIELEEKVIGCEYCQKYSDNEDPDLKVKNITFVVTERCNLACSYCYEVHKTGRRMSKKVAKDAVNFLFDKEKINGYYDSDFSSGVVLEFIGGEPLLEIDLIDYIVEYFKFKAFSLNHPWATNYMISMTSNGVLYQSEKVQQFLNRNKGRVSISITIDGNKKLHDSCRVFHDGTGSYDIVEKSIKQLVSKNKSQQTKITLCPSNIMYLNEALKNVWSLGLHGASTNCVFEEGWTNEHATILYHEMIKLADYLLSDENYKKYYTSLFDNNIGTKSQEMRNYCGGNGKMLAIAPDGKCFPCIRFMKYSLSTPGRKEQPIGDIYNGLDRKEDNKWLQELKKVNMQTQSSEKCLKCPISTGCSLCTGYDYDKFGTPNKRATFICPTHQARVMANYYYWNKLYKKLNLTIKFDLNIPEKWALNIISKKEFENLKALK